MIVAGLGIGLMVPVGKRAPVAQAATEGKPAEVARDTRLARAANGHFYTDAFVNRKTIHFIVDTGATDVALTIDDARMAGIKVDPAKFEVVGTGASGAVMGQAVSLDEVDLDGKRVRDIKGVVLQGLAVSLLGQNYLRQLHSVEISADTMTLR
jgi:aspartyl protease family protein